MFTTFGSLIGLRVSKGPIRAPNVINVSIALALNNFALSPLEWWYRKCYQWYHWIISFLITISLKDSILTGKKKYVYQWSTCDNFWSTILSPLTSFFSLAIVSGLTPTVTFLTDIEMMTTRPCVTAAHLQSHTHWYTAAFPVSCFAKKCLEFFQMSFIWKESTNNKLYRLEFNIEQDGMVKLWWWCIIN